MLSVTFLSAACTGHMREAHPASWYDSASPVGFSASVRTVNENRDSFQQSTERLLPRIRAAAGNGVINVLALSGGGAGAAFGAGALVGLTKAGTRPTFHLVTGVSAGALLSPFAFLGSDWDAELTESFSGPWSAGLVRPSPIGLLFGSSVLRGKPLADIVNHFANDALLRAVAAEAAKGRLLVVATTDLDSERTVIWDLGAIALQGGTASLALFRQVLIASASVPGLFPPVMIKVEAGGVIGQEMHVDGSTTASVFIAPEIASIFPDRLESLNGAHVYVLADGQYGTLASATRNSTEAIVRRGIQAVLHSGTRSAILATLALANDNHMHFNVTAIPDDYPFGGILDLKPERMRKLFLFGERCAISGQLWATPEELLERSSKSSLIGAGSVLACPAPP